MTSCSSTIGTLSDLLNMGTCIISESLIPLFIALAVVAFMWGVIILVINSDNEEKKKEGKKFMVWGIIALFVIISIWGLVGLLANTIGLKPLIPQLSNK